jgi:hypothetical protein
MNKITFDDLDVEFIRQEPLWGSFLHALEEFYTEDVRAPLKELQEIRDIKASTPAIFVQQALQDMGITIPQDMIVEPERLYNSVYMIPLLHQVLGLESAYRAISFVLGRRVVVRDLYTEDYADFYETPYGALRIDGGTWYKTTHIVLEMQKVADDQEMSLPQGTTLKDRFLSAFYQLAPINIVVDQFFFIIEVENTTDLGICGIVYKQPFRRLIADPEYVLENVDMHIAGPDEVDNNESADYRVVTARGSEVVISKWTTTHPQQVVFDGNRVTFSNFDTDTLVSISATVKGLIYTKNVTVRRGLVNVSLVEIHGPDSLKQGEKGDYILIAHHDDGATEIKADIKVTSPYASMIGGQLVVKTLPSNQEAGLYVEIKIGGIKYVGAKLVKLVWIDPSVHLTGLIINGEDTLMEQSEYPFQATAFYSDNTSADVLAVWESSSPSVIIDNGDVYTKIVHGTTDVEIKATHSYRGITMTAFKDVTVSPNFLTVASLEILGPQELNEEQKGQYTCIATFSNGQKTVVTPEWFTTAYSISENGILNTGLVMEFLDIEIRATYNGTIVVYPVTVRRAPVVLQSLMVSGQNTVREGTAAQYDAYVQYSNGNVMKVEPEWDLETPVPWASIVDGELVVSNPEESTVSVLAKYDISGRIIQQTKTVVVVGASNNITGLFITGPNVVNGRDRIILTATAAYEDGSFTTVNPVWEVYTEDTNAEFVAADIAGYGVIQGRSVDEDMKVMVRATYFQEVAEYEITVKYVMQKGPDVPVSSRIIGNAVMYSTQLASFSQAILFKQCTAELLVSSDWTVDSTDVRVDENGFVTALVNADITFVLTAVWSCGGYTVTDSMVVTVIPIDAAFIGLGVLGPETINLGETQRFSAEVYDAESGINPGQGKIVTAQWQVLTDLNNVQVSDNGDLRVSGPVVNQTITLAATYTADNERVEGTKQIRILGSSPFYGDAPLNTPIENLFASQLMIVNNTITENFEEYGWLVYPVVFGLATITQNGLEGDWQGNTVSGDPQVIRRETNGISFDWYVYRTKEAALGPKVYEVSFS